MTTREELAALEKAQAEAVERFAAARKAFALQECPFEIGQEVEICGWSHTGKRMIVTDIYATRGDYEGDWKVRGNVIKGDGQPGKQVTDFTHSHWQKAKEPTND